MILTILLVILAGILIYIAGYSTGHSMGFRKALIAEPQYKKDLCELTVLRKTVSEISERQCQYCNVDALAQSVIDSIHEW